MSPEALFSSRLEDDPDLKLRENKRKDQRLEDAPLGGKTRRHPK